MIFSCEFIHHALCMDENDITIIDDLQAGLGNCLISKFDLLSDVVVDYMQEGFLGLWENGG